MLGAWSRQLSSQQDSLEEGSSVCMCESMPTGIKLSESARRTKLKESALEGIWLCVAQVSCSGATAFALQPSKEWVIHLGRPVYTADCIEQSVNS